MKTTSRDYFSEEQQRRISDAVKDAELRTSGEIVPVLATASDSYPRGLFLAAIAFAIIGSLAMLALFCLPIWPESLWATGEYLLLPPSLLIFVVVQLLALLAGYRCALAVAGIHRALIPHAVMQRRVDNAAHQAFHRFRLSHTDAATGIMIYVSLFEHMVVVIADKAISKRHKAESWDKVRDLLISGIRSGDAEAGFCSAIEECGRILESDFPIQSDDINELTNELRLI